MTRLAASLLSLGFLFAVLPSALAGPACARRNWKAANCIASCQAKWGYPGNIMGTDPWGAVMKPSQGSMDTVVSEACGTAVYVVRRLPPLLICLI